MPDNPTFTEAYPADGGDIQTIPTHWLDHPVLGKEWRKTPKTVSADTKAANTTTAKEK